MTPGLDGLLCGRIRPLRIAPLGDEAAERAIARTRTALPGETAYWTSATDTRSSSASSSPPSGAGTDRPACTGDARASAPLRRPRSPGRNAVRDLRLVAYVASPVRAADQMPVPCVPT